MLGIDGAEGEGGGQVLRTALALSLVTGTPFRMFNVRAGRPRPGLRPQHLAAVRAAAEVGGAEVGGAEIGARELVFRPRRTRGGAYAFSVGTAGSATLVLQTVLPPLLVAEDASTLVLEGGTHNPQAPPFEFLARAFLPLVSRMGPKVEAALDRPGFAPAGGGRLRVVVTPAARLERLDLDERGPLGAAHVTVLSSRLPRHVAEREIETLRHRFPWPASVVEVAATGPGNAVIVDLPSRNVTEVFAGFGERGVRAETVATRVADEVDHYLSAGVPVGPHLADQLLLPLSLAGGGSFRTVAPTRHTRTQIEVIQRFLPVRIAVAGEGALSSRVEITG